MEVNFLGQLTKILNLNRDSRARIFENMTKIYSTWGEFDGFIGELGSDGEIDRHDLVSRDQF